jgi:beta-D-galactosyl-(1->4)-L-rhamnose phosphorylase
VEDYPDFCDYIEKISDEFRLIRSFHDAGRPYTIKTRVAVLHAWGKLRSWSLSGHFHETDFHDLIHINEALSGLPVEVSFINFEDIRQGALSKVDVVINAGYAGSAWSGGDDWKAEEAVTLLTRWVYEGGTYLGVGEPSAVPGYDTYFRMAHVLGVDEDTGARVCHGKWSFTAEDPSKILPEGVTVIPKAGIYLTDGNAKVLLSQGTDPLVTTYDFGKGKGIYMASFRFSLENCRMLYQLIRYGGGEGTAGLYMTDNLFTECAYYPESRKLVVINNSGDLQETAIDTQTGSFKVTLQPYDTGIVALP